MLKEFIKLNEKELQESMIDDSVAQIKRSIERKRMDLEDEVHKAKTNLHNVSVITSLKNFDSAKWVENRNEAMNKLKLSQAELENYNQNFVKEEQKGE